MNGKFSIIKRQTLKISEKQLVHFCGQGVLLTVMLTRKWNYSTKPLKTAIIFLMKQLFEMMQIQFGLMKILKIKILKNRSILKNTKK